MASAVKTHAVGAKISTRAGEPVETALRRLNKLTWDGDRWPVYRPRFGKRQLCYYQKPSELKRQRRLTDRIQKRRDFNRHLNLPRYKRPQYI